MRQKDAYRQMRGCSYNCNTPAPF